MYSSSLLLFALLIAITILCFQQPHAAGATRSFLRLRSPDGSVKNARVTFVRQYRRRPLLAPQDPIVVHAAVLANQSAISNATATTSAPPAAQNVTSDVHAQEDSGSQLNTTIPPFSNYTSVSAEERSDHVNLTSVNHTVDKISKRGPLPKYDENKGSEAKATRENERSEDRIVLHDQESRSIPMSHVPDHTPQQESIGPDSRAEFQVEADPFDPDTFMLEQIQPAHHPPGPTVTTNDPGHVLRLPDLDLNLEEITKAPDPVQDHPKEEEEEEKVPIVLPFPYTMKEIEAKERAKPSFNNEQNFIKSKRHSSRSIASS